MLHGNPSLGDNYRPLAPFSGSTSEVRIQQSWPAGREAIQPENAECRFYLNANSRVSGRFDRLG
jgi:hypothetical protein